MVLGALWCPYTELTSIRTRLREIREEHGVAGYREVKWTKLSPASLPLYRDLVNYFLDNDDLHFRAIIIPDKSKLDHERFGQTHDEWYYKMYFRLINHILDPEECYRIFLDIKDTLGAQKVSKLETVLRNANYDFDGTVVQSVQTVRSDEVSLLQMADILIGAVSFVARGLLDQDSSSSAKRDLVRRIQKRTKYSLRKSTLPRESKFNLFVWSPSE